MNHNKFLDRVSAALELAKLLNQYRGSSAIVMGIPRGGMVTAQAVAHELALPLGMIVVRKIGHPENSEFAIAAVTESGQVIKEKTETSQIDPHWLQVEVENQLAEARRRRTKYWRSRPPLQLLGKIVIIVDDGLATGLTMAAAIQEVKHFKPAKIVAAVPVSPPDTAEKLRTEVDELVALKIPQFYAGSVGNYYQQFTQVSDEEVIGIINQAL